MLQPQIAPLRGPIEMQHLWPSDMACVWPSLCCHCPQTPLSLSLSLCNLTHSWLLLRKGSVFCVCVIRGCVTDPALCDIKLGPGTVLLLWPVEVSKSRSRFDLFCIRIIWRHLIFSFVPQQVIVLNVDWVYRGSQLNYALQHLRVCRTHFYWVTQGNMNRWLRVVAPSEDFMSRTQITIIFMISWSEYFLNWNIILF